MVHSRTLVHIELRITRNNNLWLYDICERINLNSSNTNEFSNSKYFKLRRSTIQRLLYHEFNSFVCTIKWFFKISWNVLYIVSWIKLKLLRNFWHVAFYYFYISDRTISFNIHIIIYNLISFSIKLVLFMECCILVKMVQKEL